VTPPFLLATDQGWKHRLGWIAIACGLGSIFAGLRWGDDLPTEKALALIMGGNLLNLAAFVGMLASIRCPHCSTKLLWHAVSTSLGLRWYFTFTRCPTCDFTPAAALGRQSPALAAGAASGAGPKRDAATERAFAGRVLLLMAAAVVGLFAFFLVPSLMAKRRAAQAHQLILPGLPCEQATRVVATLGTKESAARLTQTCDYVQRLKSPQPAVLQFNLFTGQTYFFRVTVDADGTVGRPSRIGIR
jgi:hypothetical protein